MGWRKKLANSIKKYEKWKVRKALFIAVFLALPLGISADELKDRLKIEAKIGVKSSSANISINDIRQDISGYFLLQDSGSINQKEIGPIQGKYWLVGQSTGGYSSGGTGEFIIFETNEWSCDLAMGSKAHIDLKGLKTVYDKMGSGKFGYEYYGYLLLVNEGDGKAISVKSNKKVFEENSKKFSEFKTRDTFDKNFEAKAAGGWVQ